MSLIATFDGFVAQLRAFMTRTQEQRIPKAELDAEFNRLAAALFALQREAVPVYGEFCGKRKVTTVTDWREIPALPTAAFKEFEVSSLPAGERKYVFHSSGTTQHRPSRHFHDGLSLAVYEESLKPWFWRHFLPGGAGGDGKNRTYRTYRTNRVNDAICTLKLVVLTPSSEEAPLSSLAHMFGAVGREFGEALFTGCVSGEGAWTLDLEQTLGALREAQSAGRPVALLGTSLAFAQLLEHCQDGRTPFRLAAGSRALETGGYKGRARALPKVELRRMMTRWLGLAESHILGEYGMSELSSQAYDRVIGETDGGFRFPPWARARIVSPETGREAGDGETGLVLVVDLANVRSALAVQTEDLAARRGEGFELKGRAAGAAARGCSLLLEEL